jgi:hypothetical protein
LQVSVGLQNRVKLVAKWLKIAIYNGLQWGQNFSASVAGLEWKESVARLLPSEVAGAQSPAASVYNPLTHNPTHGKISNFGVKFVKTRGYKNVFQPLYIRPQAGYNLCGVECCRVVSWMLPRKVETKARGGEDKKGRQHDR